MQVRGSLSPTAITNFLEDATIPVRLVARTPADHLWMCSLWYRLEATAEDDGSSDHDWRLRCATAASADVVSFLESDSEVAFEVSTNDPPYTASGAAGPQRSIPIRRRRRSGTSSSGISATRSRGWRGIYSEPIAKR